MLLLVQWSLFKLLLQAAQLLEGSFPSLEEQVKMSRGSLRFGDANGGDHSVAQQAVHEGDRVEMPDPHIVHASPHVITDCSLWEGGEVC
jgi:hypothetical protein